MTGIRSRKDQHPPLAGAARGGPLTSVEKIDICRGLFAFLVVVAHSMDVALAVHPDVPGRFGAFSDLVRYGPGNGIYWVIGFFVISGFCIQLSVERLAAGGSFPLGQYAAARLTRILPLYYGALLATLAAEALMGAARPAYWPNGLDARTFAAQVLMVQDLSETFGSFASSWSLTNEVFYYLFYGPIVCLALRWGLRAPRLGMQACVAMTLLMEVAYFGIWPNACFRSTGLLFGLGIIWFLGALVAENRAAIRGSRRAARIGAAWPAVVAAGILVRCSMAVHIQVVYLVLGVGFTLMLVRFLAVDRPARGPAPDRGAAGAVIRGLGLASYPTYLFHGPIIMLAGAAVARAGLLIDWRLTWAALTAAGIGTGVVLGYLAERPIMEWRAGYLKRLRAAEGRVPAGVPVLGMQQ
jgi:peptidoglycan/LPS O-acetylase OafA/YrhL